MKQVIRWMLFSLVGVVGVGLVVAGFLLGWFDGWLAAGAEGKKPPALLPASEAVRVEVVQPAARTTVQPAHVEALERVEIVPKITGFLQALGKDLDGKDIDTGSRVKAGQVLAVLSVPELEQEVKIKEAMLTQADESVRTAREQQKVAETESDKYQADLDFREAELRRHERLFKDGGIPADLLDEKRKQSKAARAALSNADAKIALAKAELKVAEARVGVAKSEMKRAAELFEYATLRLSSAGETNSSNGAGTLGGLPSKNNEGLYVVTRRWADPGAYLYPGTGSQRASILSLARIDHVKIAIDVPELDSSRVEVGDRAIFQATALPNQKFEGKVSRFSSALEPPARTMRVEIDLPNPNGRPLYPEMYGSVMLFLSEQKGILVVPSACVRKEGEGTYVYCVAEGRVKKVSVIAGKDDGTQVEILKGLQRDSKVVRVAHGSLKDGQPVAAK